MSRDDDRESRTAGALNRRSFLRWSAVGGALALTSPALPTAWAEPRTEARRPTAGSFELEEATFDELGRRMASGEDTARSLAEKYIARIEALDGQGPELRSVLEVNPDALEIAGRLDAERRDKGPRGPLHGIPILIKDNIATADRMVTGAGSLALVGAEVPRDSGVAARLREAGAVILGKTNLSEWANFRSTHSSSGWSGRGGQCRNPYALDRTPSGSSSGSGTAAAASFCAAAIGTETDGSIVSPSTSCSLVGFKPTLGLVSRAGIVPIAHSQDTAGPMARTVRDAAILLGALVGEDPRDPATAGSRGKAHADYTRFLDAQGLRGARIGIARKGLFGYSPGADQIAEEAIDVLRRQGAVIVDPADIATVDQIDDNEFDVLLYEFKADLDKYLADLGPGAPVKTLADVITFNEHHRREEMPYFGQEILVMAQAKGPLTEKAYRKALAKDLRFSRQKGIDRTMDEHQLDALVAPTGSPPALIDLANGDYYYGGSSTSAAVAGYPHVTVPAGYYFGLPVGLSFMGRAWSEPVLLKLAYAFEQATQHRVPPRFLPTADLSSRNGYSSHEEEKRGAA